ncbi:hypothetical protein QYE76_052937 [Lolium multiflorum]|uniref:Cell wall hydroxyproline-rich glycoprotein n=1 Tax=Lolium multiflorum TaxID=4521 RepID=A0AAD8WLH5_LOLMU|nr:hypothetical protein QYE76_052937 [Lolium multiflorum]
MVNLPFPLLIVITLIFSAALALTAEEASTIARRQLLAFEQHDDHAHIDINIKISNPRLLAAHTALQSLKHALYSDPGNFTGNWDGPDVCAYNGVFCVLAPDDPSSSVVASVDMNGADVAGHLPKEIVSDLPVLHLSSNRFCGIIPEEIKKMTQLYEFDASNNLFVGPFPHAVMRVPKLSYLDIRFNDFDGPIPPELFLKPFDAIFLNNNRFTGGIPDTIGKSKASVIVLANNDLGGCIPRTIGEAAATLDQLILINNSITGCLPMEAGLLSTTAVLDVSGNTLTGSIPHTLSGLSKVEQLDLSHNKFTGQVSKGMCELPTLANLSVSYNFLGQANGECSVTMDKAFEDEVNCMGRARPGQRSAAECLPVVSNLVDCTKEERCGWPGRNLAPPTPVKSPPPVAPMLSPPVFSQSPQFTRQR